MERQLFDWTGWDQHDTAAFTFYNAKLNVKIGNFEVGTTFSGATIDFMEGTLQLFNDNQDHWDYKLNMLVGDFVKCGNYETNRD